MRFPILLLALLPSVLSLGQNATISLAAAPKLLQLAGNGLDGQILVSTNDWFGVIRAAQDLAIDVGRVTGKNLTLGNWQSGKSQGNGQKTTVAYTYHPTTSFVNYTVGPAQNFTGPILTTGGKAKTVIIAGTIGKSDVIDALVASGKLDVKPIKGQWEAFISQVISNPLPGVDRALVIAGADLRGAVFGLYDVSEQIGVSPWYWWADVPVRKAAGIWALGKTKIQKSPSVKYRGFFLNDEQPALTNWIQYVNSVSSKSCL